ncbi:hypothetical protein Tco_0637516 [Tanacetum coccineum]
MEFCTKLQERVLDLENTKTAQAQEITSLKLRVKKLEKKGGSRTHKLKRLYKVGRSARIVSFDEASLGDQEDASEQGRKIDDIDKDVEITLVDETQGRYSDDIMFDVSDLAGEEVFVAEQGVPDSKKDDAAQVNTAAITVSTASTIPVSAASITNVEITLAQALAELKSATTTTSTRPKDKGLAKIEADQLLAERLQAREQEELTIEEGLYCFFKKLLEKRRKHFAAKRSKEKRNRPPTKAQQRSINLKQRWPQESSSKRAGDELEQESIKKQKVDEDKETAELKSLMEVIPDEEEVAIDVVPLATKPLTIIDWKIHTEGKKSYYQIIGLMEYKGCTLVFRHMLKSFDREDLETLYKLVKAKYGSTRLVEDLDLVLYGGF